MAESAGIQSLDSALKVLDALSDAGAPLSLSELARRVGMPASKVHRYLASFVASGLVAQAGKSGKYDLGPGAIALGLSAMSRLDFVNRTADALPDLCAETGLTAMLSIWGNFGPTIVRWERAAGFIVTTLGLGTTMPLLGSATGRVFLAWGAPNVISMKLAEEKPGHPDLDPAEVAAQIRFSGYSTVFGKLIPGLAAISAPVLNWQNEAEAAVTLIGTDEAITKPDDPAVIALIAFCHRLSQPAPTPA